MDHATCSLFLYTVEYYPDNNAIATKITPVTARGAQKENKQSVNAANTKRFTVLQRRTIPIQRPLVRLLSRVGEREICGPSNPNRRNKRLQTGYKSAY